MCQACCSEKFRHSRLGYNFALCNKGLPRMSVGHYENFPVGSILLPRRVRRAVHAIYRFARSADDIADEGDLPAAERLARLDAYRAELNRIEAGQAPQTPLFVELAAAIRRHDLPLQPFRDLLDAFGQDVVKTRYADVGEVIAYCRRSANPVGRLMLHLFGETDPQSLARSDGICTALQLINFLQDVEIDWRKDRVYLPQDELAKYRVSETQIASGDTSGLWGTMMLAQIKRARAMLAAGAPLGKKLGGRFGFELRMIVMGGEVILRKLHKSQGDVFRQRPVLGWRDWCYIVYRALRAN